jgi:NAD(P)-dependent dehydrogenase (short-subunit alcohol dehydrogenase family)
MRTVLVTGGNRGLGLETCRQLGQRGFRVLLASRSDDGEAAARTLAGGDRLPIEWRQLDVTDDRSVGALASAFAAERLHLDVLVNNAGVALNGFNADIARRTLDVNFFGALRVTDALLPFLPEGGHIVMVSSGMGELSVVTPALRAQLTAPDLTRARLLELMRGFVDGVARGTFADAGWPASAYRTSKVGLNALTRVLARDLADRRIAVNAVCPAGCAPRSAARARHARWRRAPPRSLRSPRSSNRRAAASTATVSRFPGDGTTACYFSLSSARI